MATAIRTAEQLFHAGDLGRCELVRGTLVMMNPTGGVHGRVALRIAAALSAHVDAHALGTVLAAETGFVLSRDPDTVRAPDVAFVRAGREIGDGFIEGAPELAVEVLSPGDRPGYVREKVAEWLESGSEAVWVVDPRARTVVVHGPDGHHQALSARDTLAGGRTVPGLELPLSRVF